MKSNMLDRDSESVEDFNVPEFTIITPVHNGESFLEDTIMSVLAYANGVSYEYIVVDNGSTDGTKDIIESFGKKIKYIQEEQRGEGFAVNTGMKAGRGKYALVVNCDDPLFTQEIFTGISSIFQMNPKVVAIYSDWRVIDPKGNVVKLVFPRSYSRKSLIAELDCLPGPGSFFKLTAAVTVGGRNPYWMYVSDYEFWLRMSAAGDFIKRPGVYAQWRIHDQSITGSSNENRITEQRNLAAENFVKTTKTVVKLRRQALSNIYFQQFMYGYYTNSKFLTKKLFLSGLNGLEPFRSANIRITVFMLMAKIKGIKLAN